MYHNLPVLFHPSRALLGDLLVGLNLAQREGQLESGSPQRIS